MGLLEWTVDQPATTLSSPVPTIGETLLFPSLVSDVEIARDIFQIGTPEPFEVLQVNINLTSIQTCASRNPFFIPKVNPYKPLWVFFRMIAFGFLQVDINLTSIQACASRNPFLNPKVNPYKPLWVFFRMIAFGWKTQETPC
jgi:hypothetical protein